MQTRSLTLHNYRRSLIFGALIGLGVGISFAAGFFFRGLADPVTAQAGETNYPLLTEVQITQRLQWALDHARDSWK